MVANNGKVISEIHNGRNAEEIKNRLVSDGCIVISVSRLWLSNLDFGGQEKNHEIHLVFCDQMRALLDAGISVSESLVALYESEANIGFKKIISEIIVDVESGKSLSMSLSSHSTYFPEILLSTLKAAERTGALSDALARYSHFQHQFDEFREKLWAAAAYPLLLLGIGGAVIMFLMFYVVPRFSLVYHNMQGDLPWSVQLLLTWGGFVEGHSKAMFLAFAIILILIISVWRQLALKVSLLLWIKQLPFVNKLMYEIQLSHYFHSLSLLLLAGISLPKALELSQNILARNFRQASETVVRVVSQGERLSDALEKNGLATPVALRLIQAGERSGQLAEMLSRAASFHDKHIIHTIEILSKIVGPVLMVLMGLLIGGIVILLYMPIFHLAEGIS